VTDRQRLTLAILFSIGIHATVVFVFIYIPSRPFHFSFLSVEFKKGQTKTHSVAAKPHASGKEKGAINRISPSVESSQPSAEKEAAPILGAAFGIRVEYPRLSRLMNEQGDVVVEISDLKSLRIFSSSGFSRLDDAALAASRDAVQDGLVNSVAKFPLKLRYVFKLTSE